MKLMLSIDLKDKFLLLASSLLALFASYMLSKPTPIPFSVRTNKAPIAEVRSYSNIVKKKPAESLSWQSVNNQNQLFQGDQIFTHENSFAEISYKNSASLNLLPNTLLKIDENSDGVNIDLKKGFLSLNFDEKSSKKINLNVGNKKIEIASKNASFQISSIKSSGLITLLKGQAKIGTGAKEKTIQLGDSLKFDNSKKDFEISKIENFPLHPSMGQKIDPAQGGINLKWKSLFKDEGLVTYKILISKNADLKNAQSYEVNEKSKVFEYLPPGSYYWKVVTKNGSGPVSNFTISDPGVPNIVGPTDNEVQEIDMNEKLASTKLSWNGSYPKGYLVSIISDSNGNQEKILETKDNFLVLNQIKNASYSWKVKVNEENAPWSQARRFTVNRQNYLKLISPSIGKSFNILSIKEKIPFEWVGLETSKYKLQIFKDELMEQEIFSDEVKGTKVAIRVREFGTYFWKVSSLDFPEIFTQPQIFSVNASIASLSMPKDKSKFLMLGDSFKVKFSWKNLGLKSFPAQLQVSMKESFDEILNKKDLKNKSTSLNLDIPGIYFWRIVPIKANTPDTSSISQSAVRTFEIGIPPAPSPPNIAINQILEPLKGYNIEQYKIEWPKVKYSREYLIEIFEKEDLATRITRAKVKSTKILWRGERSGAFYYRVKVFDLWGRESGWSKTGKLIAPISPFD